MTEGIKIRCANRYWSRAVQLLLAKHIGASWGKGAPPVPWNTSRLWLAITRGWDDRWYIRWIPEFEFEAVGLPEWDAKALIAAAPKLPTPGDDHAR